VIRRPIGPVPTPPGRHFRTALIDGCPGKGIVREGIVSHFNLFDLQQERARKALNAKELLDSAEKADPPRVLSADEIVIFDRLTGEVDQLDGEITQLQAHLRRREENEKRIDALERPNGRITAPAPPVPPATTTAVMKIPASARRTGVLKAFKGPDAEERAYRAGMWLRAAVFRDQKAAQWCLNNGLGVDIRGAMSTTTPADGGFLVPEEWSRAVIDLREQYGVFRQNARVWPMGSDTLHIPKWAGGVTIGPIAENPTPIAQSSPTFAEVLLVAKKCGGLTLMSSEIAEDAVIDLADWLAMEFAWGFALFEDRCGFIGDGTAGFLSIAGLTNVLTTASTLKGAVAAAVGHDTFAEVDHADLAALMGVLPQYARANAKFYCSSVANEMIFGRLKAVAGGNTVQTLQGDIGNNYLGYPIVISQVLPSGGTINGTAMLFFGDLSKSSALGDRRQVRVFPSEHRYMDTDQIGIRGTERFDIKNHSVGTTTEAGPVVGLMGKTT
jgi:HK97 family phage major capsid protein